MVAAIMKERKTWSEKVLLLYLSAMERWKRIAQNSRLQQRFELSVAVLGLLKRRLLRLCKARFEIYPARRTRSERDGSTKETTRR